MRRSCLCAIFGLVALAALPSAWPARADPPGADATAKLSALVEPVAVDDSLRGQLPAFYSADTLTREIATALEATGVFTVPTRDPREIHPVIEELRRGGGHSTKFTRARFVMEPVITSITLDRRVREAPHMRSQVLESVSGSASLFVTVIDTRDGSVSKRLPIEVHYATAERLADGDPDQMIGDGRAVHGDANAAAYVGLCEAIGRALAKRVLDQVSPVFVAQRDGDHLFLTRGEDAGYHIGEPLRVIHRGSAIIHPVTHEVLGYDEREVGTVQVIEVLPKLSIARITQSSGEIATGDIVREPVDESGN